MANEEEKVDVEETVDEETPETELDESTDWEAEAKKARGIAARLRTKLTKATETKKPEAPKKTDSSPQTKSEFDYGELAYLTAKGVSDEDTDYLFQEAKSTGKPLKELLSYNYVKEELKGRAEARATKEATPSGSKRTGPGSSNTVDFWIAKINSGTSTVLDIPDRDLRSQVVKARRKIATDGKRFTDNPVA